jgi:hypothetical protein
LPIIAISPNSRHCEFAPRERSNLLFSRSEFTRSRAKGKKKRPTPGLCNTALLCSGVSKGKIINNRLLKVRISSPSLLTGPARRTIISSGSKTNQTLRLRAYVLYIGMIAAWAEISGKRA